MPTPGSCREAPPLAAKDQAAFASAAASWSGGDYDVASYPTIQDALDGYAAFHAHALAEPSSRRAPSLVFVPNQYGLGNRLRAMKASLLIALLTGRVFHVKWDEPFPVHALLKPERIDWRMPPSPPSSDGAASEPALPAALSPTDRNAEAQILCLPFATAPAGWDCASGLNALQRQDLRKRYASVRVLEVHTFTDLNIYLQTNPHYANLLGKFSTSCPKRMGCLYDFLFSAQPVVERNLDALLAPLRVASSAVPDGAAADNAAADNAAADGAAADGPDHRAEIGPYYGVQVRNRLWLMEKTKLPGGRLPASGRPADTSPARVVECMSRYVPPGASVFFTADDGALYAPARARWGERLLSVEGGVFMPWSRGGKVDASTLGEEDERAVLKAVVDWFALKRAHRIVYTYQSSFGKTAAEASDAPNLDVNQTRCAASEMYWRQRVGEGGAGATAEGVTDEGATANGATVESVAQGQALWEYEWSQVSANGVAYDLSQVPGARGSDFPGIDAAP